MVKRAQPDEICKEITCEKCIDKKVCSWLQAQNKGDHAWIQTHSGKAFDYLRPELGSVTIEDIAHALGNICRYCGHTNRFYSVAEHCVVGSWMVLSKVKLHFLLHDALEAYIQDLPRPLKALLPEYKAIEKRLEPVVYAALNIAGPSVKEEKMVKEADVRMLLTEQPQLLLPPPKPWSLVAEPYPIDLPCWLPEEASAMYLRTYKMLRDEV